MSFLPASNQQKVPVSSVSSIPVKQVSLVTVTSLMYALPVGEFYAFSALYRTRLEDRFQSAIVLGRGKARVLGKIDVYYKYHSSFLFHNRRQRGTTLKERHTRDRGKETADNRQRERDLCERQRRDIVGEIEASTGK